MAVKYSDDPARLKQELDAANARNRILSKQVNAVTKERKAFQKAQEEAGEAVAAREAAEKNLDVAAQRIDSLEKELASEKSGRAAERNIVENAKALKRAFEAL